MFFLGVEHPDERFSSVQGRASSWQENRERETADCCQATDFSDCGCLVELLLLGHVGHGLLRFDSLCVSISTFTIEISFMPCRISLNEATAIHN